MRSHFLMINDLNESVLNKAYYKMFEPPVAINQGMDLASGCTFELLMLFESGFNLKLNLFLVHLFAGFGFLSHTKLVTEFTFFVLQVYEGVEN